MKKAAFIIFLLLGIVFRYLFIYFHPEPFVYDQVEYNFFAENILKSGLFAVPARLYGYPLYLAIIYFFFGSANPTYWQTVNIILDVGTAIMLFFIAKSIFGKKSDPSAVNLGSGNRVYIESASGSAKKPVAWIVYVFYLFNPFTSPYTGIRMTEIPTFFAIVLIYYLTILFLEKKKIYSAIILALVLGYLPQIKPAFLYFSVTVLLVSIYLIIRQIIKTNINKFKIILLMFLAFIIPFIYSVAGNFKYYKTISLMTVDNLMPREFYLSLFMKRSPLHATSIYDYPPEVRTIYNEYSSVPKDARGRKIMAAKYLNLALSTLFSRPLYYLGHYTEKAFFIWEKHSFFYYLPETKNQNIINTIYFGNCIFVVFSLFCLLSLTYQSFRKKDKTELIFFGLVLFLVLYISGVYMFSTSEERFSLPAYPFLFIFLSYGIWVLIGKIDFTFRRIVTLVKIVKK